MGPSLSAIRGEGPLACGPARGVERFGPLEKVSTLKDTNITGRLLRDPVFASSDTQEGALGTAGSNCRAATILLSCPLHLLDRAVVTLKINFSQCVDLAEALAS